MSSHTSNSIIKDIKTDVMDDQVIISRLCMDIAQLPTRGIVNMDHAQYLINYLQSACADYFFNATKGDNAGAARFNIAGMDNAPQAIIGAPTLLDEPTPFENQAPLIDQSKVRFDPAPMAAHHDSSPPTQQLTPARLTASAAPFTSGSWSRKHNGGGRGGSYRRGKGQYYGSVRQYPSIPNFNPEYQRNGSGAVQDVPVAVKKASPPATEEAKQNMVREFVRRASGANIRIAMPQILADIANKERPNKDNTLAATEEVKDEEHEGKTEDEAKVIAENKYKAKVEDEEEIDTN